MSDDLMLPVEFEGQELEFPIRPVQRGFQRGFVVDIDGTEIFFERDDANEVRAVLADPEKASAKDPSTALIQAVAEVIALLG